MKNNNCNNEISELESLAQVLEHENEVNTNLYLVYFVYT